MGIEPNSNRTELVDVENRNHNRVSWKFVDAQHISCSPMQQKQKIMKSFYLLTDAGPRPDLLEVIFTRSLERLMFYALNAYRTKLNQTQI